MYCTIQKRIKWIKNRIVLISSSFYSFIYQFISFTIYFYIILSYLIFRGFKKMGCLKSFGVKYCKCFRHPLTPTQGFEESKYCQILFRTA
jgi:hypothetical protein